MSGLNQICLLLCIRGCSRECCKWGSRWERSVHRFWGIQFFYLMVLCIVCDFCGWNFPVLAVSCMNCHLNNYIIILYPNSISKSILNSLKSLHELKPFANSNIATFNDQRPSFHLISHFFIMHYTLNSNTLLLMLIITLNLTMTVHP